MIRQLQVRASERVGDREGEHLRQYAPPEQCAVIAQCGVPSDVAASMQLAVAAEGDVRAHRAERANLNALYGVEGG